MCEVRFVMCDMWWIMLDILCVFLMGNVKCDDSILLPWSYGFGKGITCDVWCELYDVWGVLCDVWCMICYVWFVQFNVMAV